MSFHAVAHRPEHPTAPGSPGQPGAIGTPWRTFAGDAEAEVKANGKVVGTITAEYHVDTYDCFVVSYFVELFDPADDGANLDCQSFAVRERRFLRPVATPTAAKRAAREWVAARLAQHDAEQAPEPVAPASEWEARQAEREGRAAGAKFARAERDADDRAATLDGSVRVRTTSSEDHIAAPEGALYDSLDAYDAMLRDARHRAPKGGAYTKVRFAVYIDGEVYEGRYDVQDADHPRMTIVEHMRANIAYTLDRSPFATDEHRESARVWAARLDRVTAPKVAGGCTASASATSDQADWLDWIGA